MRPSDSVPRPKRTPEQIRLDERLSFGDTTIARNHADLLARSIGTFTQPQPDVTAAVLRRCAHSQLPLDAINAMATYRPRANPLWESISEFVNDACSLAAPQTAYTTKLLLTVATPFVTWCVVDQGWPLQADVIFSRQAIAMYCSEPDPRRAEGTRRNYRAMLTRISEVVAPDEHPDAYPPLSRKRSATPYTTAEIEGFRLWANGQRTEIKCRKAKLMMIFCAGAGLRPIEIIDLGPDDVTVDDHGVLLNVGGGTHPRHVPLAREWEDWIIPILDTAPSEHPLWGPPNRSDGGNLLSSFTQYTTGKHPRGDRLRSTWIVAQLQVGTPIKELFKAAGFDKFENLPRYLEFVNPLDDDGYRTALRGEDR